MNCAQRHEAAFVVAHHIGKNGMTQSFSSIGSGAGTYSVGATVHSEWRLEEITDRKGDFKLTCGGRRIKEQSFALRDAYPGFEFIGDAAEVARENAEKEAKETQLYQVCVSIANKEGDWTGSAKEIENYALDNEYQVMNITKKSFKAPILTALKSVGVGYQYRGNGTGGGKHRIYKLNAPLEFDSLIG
jgi:hypothetical protein